MIVTYCDKCGKEIKHPKQNIYLKTSNQDICNCTYFKGILCEVCEYKLKKTIRILAKRYGLIQD